MKSIALPTYADVAELVDALVSGISVARRGGSSPLIRTKFDCFIAVTKKSPSLIDLGFFIARYLSRLTDRRVFARCS